MAQLLAEGGQIAILGMVVVFAILILLVFAVKGMSRIALSLEPAGSGSPENAGVGPGLGSDSEMAAVVTAAIDAYRRRQKRH